MRKNSLAKKLFKIGLGLGTIISLYFVPWILIWAWIVPLPDTIQEQVDEAIGHGFDGIRVYIDEAGKPVMTFYLPEDE